MKNSVLYIVGATLLGGGAFLFLKNKKAKDLSKLAEAEKLAGTTSGGTTPSEITPKITEPVKIDKDANLDAYNLQQILTELLPLNKTWEQIKLMTGTSIYISTNEKRQPLLDKLAKLGYKFENGLLIKI